MKIMGFSCNLSLKSINWSMENPWKIRENRWISRGKLGFDMCWPGKARCFLIKLGWLKGISGISAEMLEISPRICTKDDQQWRDTRSQWSFITKDLGPKACPKPTLVKPKIFGQWISIGIDPSPSRFWHSDVRIKSVRAPPKETGTEPHRSGTRPHKLGSHHVSPTILSMSELYSENLSVAPQKSGEKLSLFLSHLGKLKDDHIELLYIIDLCLSETRMRGWSACSSLQ